jgi:hypothetical protein
MQHESPGGAEGGTGMEQTENRVMGMAKKPRKGVKKIHAAAMKSARLLEGAEGGVELFLEYVDKATSVLHTVRCSEAMYKRMKTGGTGRVKAPALNRFRDTEFLVGMESVEGVPTCTSIDIVPRLDGFFRDRAAAEGEENRRSYLFEVDQASGSFQMRKSAEKGTVREVLRLIELMDPLGFIEPGMVLKTPAASYGFVSSISGNQLEVVPER